MTITINVIAADGEHLREQLIGILGASLSNDAKPCGPALENILTLPTAIGAELQGGIYVGPHRHPNGKIAHLITARESVGKFKFGTYEGDLSTVANSWDGQSNTAALLALPDTYPAAQACRAYRGGGFNDWYHGAQNEVALAQINVSHLFLKEWHGTSTPYDSYSAWAVDFEFGHVGRCHRLLEFRVRPFRRFIP